MDLQKLLKIVAIVIGVISIFFLGILYLREMKIKLAKTERVNMLYVCVLVLLAIAVLLY